MVVTGWVLTGLETARAAVGHGFDSGTGVLSVTGDANNNSISVYADGNDVIVKHGGGEDTVMSGGSNISKADVHKISIVGAGGHDTITLVSVSTENGWTNLLSGEVSIWGDAGNDSIVGRDSPGEGDWLFGGADNDSIVCGSGADTAEGNAGADSIIGGNDGDSLLGGDGADTILGGNGGDDIFGGPGADSLMGEGDNDWLRHADAGNSTASDASRDTLDGGGGSDDWGDYNVTTDDDQASNIEQPLTG